MQLRVLMVTQNKGKLLEVAKRFERYGLSVVSPEDFGMKVDIPETGRTLEANAEIKVRLFAARLKSHNLLEDNVVDLNTTILMADDTGLMIDALGGEPGVKARRWKNSANEMSDEEVIDYCLEKMQQVPPEARTAEFRTVIAVLFPGEEEPEFYSGKLRGLMLVDAGNRDFVPGLPYDSLFYLPEQEKTLAEIRKLSDTEKQGFLTHREIAVDLALEGILRRLADRQDD